MDVKTHAIAAACMPCKSLGLHIIIRVVANYFTALAICTAFISYYFPCMYIHYEILYRSTDPQFLEGYIDKMKYLSSFCR